jgi:1,2-diacylglycerol 3-alpha-glucosyltransferase
MRIGIFTDRYLPQIDGISFSIETFRIELEKLGHEVYIFAPKPSWRYREPSNKVIRFNAVKGLFFEDHLTSLFFPPQAMRQIDRMKLDIIHFQTPGQIGLLGAYYALRNHIPLVTTYHTDLYEYVKHYPAVLPGTLALSLLAPAIMGGGRTEYRQTISSLRPERSVDKWNQKMVVHGLTMLHNRCDLVITPSKKIEQQLASWKTTSRIVILPTGVDKITTTRKEVLEVREKYGLNETDQVILFVGRIGTEKNLGVLIRAFSTVCRHNPRAKLMLCGTGDDIEFFQAQAASSAYGDRIIFTGQIAHDKLGAYYANATVLGFPSQTDTQGMAINEAACSGVPVVMVDRDISEVVVDGVNGLYAKNSTRDFAAKLSRVLSDKPLRERMSEHGVELASRVSASKQAIKLLRFYSETIERYDAKIKVQRPAVKL